MNRHFSGILLCGVAFVVGATACAEEGQYWSDTPVTCHWIGAARRGYTIQAEYESGVYPIPQAAYGEWTNQNNWAEGIVPGRFKTIRDGVETTVGCEGCTAVFDGNCQMRVIEVNGLVSIKDILVTGATAPRFVFGHWQWDNPHLRIECGGSIRVTADVPEAPYIVPQIVPVDVPQVSGQTLLTIENNSPGEFCIGYLGKVDPQFTAWVGNEIFRCEGTGAIRKRNKTYNSNWGGVLDLAMNGGTYVVATSYLTSYGFSSCDNAYYVKTSAEDPRQHIEIPDGKALSLDEPAPFDSVRGDLLIDGAGVLYLSRDNADSVLAMTAGKTLEIAVAITNSPKRTRIAVGKSGMTGTVRLSGQNTFSASLDVCNQAVCEVSGFGRMGNPSPVGRGGVTISNPGTVLRYVGPGETTDRKLSGSGFGTFETASDGDLVWTGEFSAPNLTYSYSIVTSGKGRFVFATPEVTKYLEFEEGARIGFAKPNEGDSIAVSKVNIDGNVTVDVRAGANVSIATLTRTSNKSYKIDFALAEGATLAIGGLSAGPTPNWITVNGGAAYCNDRGQIYTPRTLANTKEIAAHGDRVPNAPTEAVGISSVGDPESGNDSLAAASTAVFALNHEVAEPTTVAFAAGESLDAKLIRLRAGAGDLTLGTTVGTGAVKSSEGALELVTADAGQTITVKAALANPASVPLKIDGPGTTVLASLRSVAAVDSAVLTGAGMFDFSVGSLKLADSGANGVTAEVTATDPARIDVAGGKLTLTGDRMIPVEKIIVGNGELVVNGPHLQSAGVSIDTADATQPPEAMEVGSTNCIGVLRFENGSFTGRLSVATYGSVNARGAVYQKGGEIVNVTTYGETTLIGRHGYAYYELSGGRYVAAGDWYLGSNGEGIMNVTDGEVWHTPASVHKSRFRLGNGTSYTQLLVGEDGYFNATNVQEAVVFPGYNRNDSSGQLTVENGGRFDCSTKALAIGYGYGSTPVYNIVNLNNGGTIGAAYVARNTSYMYPTEEWPYGTSKEKTFTNTYACVNCDGGVLSAHSWSSLFGEIGSTYDFPPNRVTLYEGGLTIDTTGFGGAIGFGGELKAPSGQGVATVVCSADDLAWLNDQGLVGPPIVKIVGDGKGASAVADFDSDTGKVIGFRVTGPGNDYTTAQAQLIWNKTVRRTLSCALRTCVSGGLTKEGSGTLWVDGTNMYTGVTCIKKGVIQLRNDDVFNSVSKLVLDGGTLNMNGHHQVFSGIECNGGAVSNGKPEVSGLTIDFADVREGKTVTLDAGCFAYADGATLTVLGMEADDFADESVSYMLASLPNGVPEGFPSLDAVQAQLPEGWSIKFLGKRLVIRYQRGALLIVR